MSSSDVKSRDEYFNLLENRTPRHAGPLASETGSHEEKKGLVRVAEPLEVAHIADIASGGWKRLCDEDWANSMFFHRFVCNVPVNETTTLQLYALIFLPRSITAYRHLFRGSQSWPFNLVTKCAAEPIENQLRLFRPRSDFLVLKSNLP